MQVRAGLLTSLENCRIFHDTTSDRLYRMCIEEHAVFLDLISVWSHYAHACGKPREWLYRDNIHATDRGRQILARVLERYFSPR
ncbi:MAG: hypothetical protein AUJ92_17765 [Armatimonadetes bacterium CG2_30_59_28]|nr:hypothetical protein [Armatimonadota bacterium]OIO90820.1 MAG: hypothetical protein AUJ92_17765 [Armatimonadetes bacterium CG2_30_59_28]PIU66205.1 MAG: hypothetical protein COS85_05745 [Armatimonadetes bacterium CG07_land_8_20_14_0_80_59_28]PIX39421.1 MAG: hypothetical protein COZ56_17635 [Armatimonadetes bacterium CG_4_8_14_3_um_filter_58_9]